MVQHPHPDGVQVHTAGPKNPFYLCHQVIGEKFALLSRILMVRLEGVNRMVEAEACIQPQVEVEKNERYNISIWLYNTNLEICSNPLNLPVFYFAQDMDIGETGAKEVGKTAWRWRRGGEEGGVEPQRGGRSAHRLREEEVMRIFWAKLCLFVARIFVGIIFFNLTCAL